MSNSSSVINIVAFILATIGYYFALAPKLTIQEIDNKQHMNKYFNKKMGALGIYLFLVVGTQLLANIFVVLPAICGGSAKDNMNKAIFLTVFPWLFMFGSVLFIINTFPGLKTVFSDVIGYFYVSNSANNNLVELLIDENIREHIEDTNISDNEKNKIAKTADAIIRICGNTSILLNRMFPSNFNEFWKVLEPLKKSKYQLTKNENGEFVEPPEALGIKTTLLNLVVSKDTVGEAMWIIYSGILVCFIVQMQIATSKCDTNADTINQNYDDYEAKQEQVEEDKQNNPEPVYTIE